MKGLPGRINFLVSFALLWAAQACFMPGWGWAGFILTLAGWAVLWRGGKEEVAGPEGTQGKNTMVALALFALALALRLYRLDSHPPFWWDEGVQAFDVRSVLAGRALEPLGEIRYHRSPLWTGILSSFVFLFGHSITALRLASVLAGSLVPVLAFFLVNRMLGLPSGILAGLFLAWHPWLLHQSRNMQGNILTPAMALVILLVAANRRISLGWRGVAVGLVAGVNMYGYAASYHLPLLGALALLLVPVSGGGWKPRLASAATALGISIAFALPSAIFLNDYWVKTIDVSAGGKPAIIWQNMLGTARMFHMEGDPDMRHWYPAGSPVLGPLLGPLFSLGLGLALAGRLGWAGGLALGWLVLGLVPGLVTSGGDRNIFRMIGAAPAVALLCSAGGAGVLRYLGVRLGLAAVMVVWLATGWADIRTYFSGYANDPATSSVFRVYAGEAGKELAGAASAGKLVICPVLTVARHPIEKLSLWEAIADGRVTFIEGPGRMAGEKKVFRDGFGQPQAVMFRNGNRIDYHAMMDILMEGDRLQALDRAGDSGAYYRSWQAIFPDSYLLMERVGFADLKAGKSGQAVREFREAVRRGSKLASTWDGLASALFRTGKYEEAIQAMEMAVQLEPGNRGFREDLETVKRAAGKQKQGGN